MLALRRHGSPVASFLLIALSGGRSALAQEPCFERLDNGVDMTGWHPSPTNHHGPGAGWTVEDGAFVGRQTGNQQGGILMTDASYTDVEVVFEVKLPWGCDSGFFFRTTAGDRAYQVTIDHLAESGVGTIYGESFAQELRAIPYWLTNEGNAAIVAPDQNQQPIFDLATWPTIWDPTDFNEVRARIEGNPPRLQVWISGTKVMDFTDGMQRNEIEAAGPLAIQVHSGGRWIAGGSVAYRNIRVKDLTVACNDPGVGGSGGGGAAGAGGAAGGGGAGGASGGAGGASGGAGGASGVAAAAGGGYASGAGGAGGGFGGVGGVASAVGGGGAASGGVGNAPSGVTAGNASNAAPGSDSGCSCSLPATSTSSRVGLVALLVLVGVGLSRRPAGRPTP